jgi:hypothetical protein
MTSEMHRTDIVLATDGTPYQTWQCEVFAYSMKKVEQQGRYTILVNDSDEELTYPTHNRIKALKKYLQTTDAKYIYMMDPDMIFVGKLEVYPKVGEAIGDPARIHWWHEILAHESILRSRFSRKPHRELAFTQVPWIIRREELSAIIERWDELIYSVFNDKEVLDLPHWNRWVTTSWCYWLALAEFGITQRVMQLVNFSAEDELHAPIIHYPHRMKAGFYKRDYVPWTKIKLPEEHHPVCEHIVIDTINKFSASKQAV